MRQLAQGSQPLSQSPLVMMVFIINHCQDVEHTLKLLFRCIFCDDRDDIWLFGGDTNINIKLSKLVGLAFNTGAFK